MTILKKTFGDYLYLAWLTVLKALLAIISFAGVMITLAFMYHFGQLIFLWVGNWTLFR